MARNLEAVKSPSFAKQKVASQGKVQWEDVCELAIELVEKEASLQPTPVPGTMHRHLELLRLIGENVVEEFKTNTACKQRFCEKSKRRKRVSLSDVAPGQKGPLSSMQSLDVAEKAAKDTIVWALEQFKRAGRLPETADQRNARENKEMKQELAQVKAENERLRGELELCRTHASKEQLQSDVGDTEATVAPTIDLTAAAAADDDDDDAAAAAADDDAKGDYQEDR